MSWNLCPEFNPHGQGGSDTRRCTLPAGHIEPHVDSLDHQWLKHCQGAKLWFCFNARPCWLEPKRYLVQAGSLESALVLAREFHEKLMGPGGTWSGHQIVLTDGVRLL